MNKRVLKILLPFAIFAVQWVIWGVWQVVIVPRLPMSNAVILIDAVLVKALIWAAPFAFILRRRKREGEKTELFKKPFPWFVLVVLLCAATAFLYTVRIVSGRMDMYPVFSPMYIVFSLSAGVYEEFSFRSGLFDMQKPLLGTWLAAGVNGALFLLYHYPEILFFGNFGVLISWRALLIFVMGIAFCLMYRKWHNIALNMTVHTVWDVLSYIFYIAG